MNITIFGAGYIGTVTAACFAKLGHNILIIDIDKRKVELINGGHSPIKEPGIDILLKEFVLCGKIKAALNVAEEIFYTDIIMVCVATPSDNKGKPNLTYLRNTLNEIYHNLSKTIIDIPLVIRSTVLPGYLSSIIDELTDNYNYHARVVLNPEFLRESTAIYDFFNPPFLVMGSDDPIAINAVLKLYAGIHCKKYCVSFHTSSLVKYACNAFHALKITFSNEIAKIADSIGADPIEVMNIVSSDSVLNCSPAYMRPGFIFGGSCLPKDLRTIQNYAELNSIEIPVLNGILLSNKILLDTTIKEIISSGIRNAILIGLSFKLGSDDLRESPYVLLAMSLINAGINLKIYDPEISINKKICDKNSENILETNLFNHTEKITNTELLNTDGIIYCKNLLDKKTLELCMKNNIKIFDIENHIKRQHVEIMEEFIQENELQCYVL